MTFITHILGGAASVALMDTVLTSFSAEKLHFVVGAVFATLPDIDYSRSFVGRTLYPIARSIEAQAGHRTMTHSFLFAGIIASVFGVLFAFVLNESLMRWFFLIFISYSSHFFLDWFTKEGCASYWPAKIWCVIPKRRSWRIRTGQAGEMIFFLILSLFFIVLFQPTREGVTVWFRSSFTQSKDAEMSRFDIQRKEITHGFTRTQIDSLFQEGILTLQEHSEISAKLDKIDINESITRKMYGLPERTGDNSSREETTKISRDEPQ